MTSSRQRTDSQRKANARLGWILASAAAVFALGFVAKIVVLTH
ncbi:MAG TPA: cytochrome oxidase small assembly protein [Burkholderiaceae bacterium]|nr:cytochrome oxidase small assembly protein [Burkholderiaceae bacterium]